MFGHRVWLRYVLSINCMLCYRLLVRYFFSLSQALTKVFLNIIIKTVFRSWILLSSSIKYVLLLRDLLSLSLKLYVLLQSLARLKDDVITNKIPEGFSSTDVSTLSLPPFERLNTASQTDLSGEVGDEMFSSKTSPMNIL